VQAPERVSVATSYYQLLPALSVTVQAPARVSVATSYYQLQRVKTGYHPL